MYMPWRQHNEHYNKTTYMFVRGLTRVIYKVNIRKSSLQRTCINNVIMYQQSCDLNKTLTVWQALIKILFLAAGYIWWNIHAITVKMINSQRIVLQYRWSVIDVIRLHIYCSAKRSWNTAAIMGYRVLELDILVEI